MTKKQKTNVFKTKKEALESLSNLDSFYVEDRGDVLFQIKEVNAVKYVIRLFENQQILEQEDALKLAADSELHIESSRFIESFVDDSFNIKGEKSGTCKRIVAETTVITKDGKKCCYTASAGSDNSGKRMRSYVVEVALKRSLVRSIIRALKIESTWGTIEFNPSHFDKNEEDKTSSVSNESATEPINKSQISAIKNIINGKKGEEEFLLKKCNEELKKYNVSSVDGLNKKQASSMIVTLQNNKQ